MTKPAEWIASLPEDRRPAVKKLRAVIRKNLPKGFKEVVDGKILSWVVPHSRYPDGYHCNPEQPLPFMSLASQKNFVALYHMGIYADAKLLAWFQKQWPKHVASKLDMGKSCVRMKKIETIPYQLNGELAGRVSVDDWIQKYEKNIRR